MISIYDIRYIRYTTATYIYTLRNTWGIILTYLWLRDELSFFEQVKGAAMFIPEEYPVKSFLLRLLDNIFDCNMMPK